MVSVFVPGGSDKRIAELPVEDISESTWLETFGDDVGETFDRHFVDVSGLNVKPNVNYGVPVGVMVGEFLGVDDVDDFFSPDFGVDEVGDVGVFEVVGWFVFVGDVVDVADEVGEFFHFVFVVDGFADDPVEFFHC